MRKVAISNRRNNDRATFPATGPGGNTERDADELVTEPRSTYGFYVDWCYHVSSTWISWYLLGKTEEEEQRKTEEVESTPARVDSGVGLHLLGQDQVQLSRPNASTPPIPISLTFIFEDGTITKNLDYRVYSRWTNINLLIHGLARDSIVVDELWDVNEDMPISSGDWDARIQPGSVIDAWCFDNRSGDDRDEDSDGSEDESGEEVKRGCAYDILKNRSSEHIWWFTRWRQRVEKAIPGRHEVTDEPSWLLIVLWCTATITIIALIILLNQ